MAGPRTAPAKAEPKADEPGTEPQTTPAEQDVTAQNEAAAAAALAAAEPQADPRDSALAKLLSGTAEPAITPADEPEIDVSNVQDFGGRSRAVVLFSRYNQFVDGIVKTARKGDVIDTDADNLKRGIRIKALRKLEG
ncbi:hypothetical protein SEA_HIRKO_10 [Arthrobacter phage Hirko]|nr:hypothetical protein SEA_HIRKO_10 [Arthrobacter phage Hirko]